MKLYRYLSETFAEYAVIYWTGLSHLNTLLVVSNITLFFVTRLVIDEGYYYTFYSLICLIIVAMGILLPLGFVARLWYYLIFLFVECVAVWFIVVSVWFWVKGSR